MASTLTTISCKKSVQKHKKILNKTNGIFWKTEDCKKSQFSTDAYVPGVDPSNNKKFKNSKWQPYKVQPKSLITSSGHIVEDISHSTNKSEASENRRTNQSTFHIADNSNFPNDNKKVLLKDLCQEDKLRIATLIQELAKAGEEREVATTMLNQEREGYEKKLKELSEQIQLLSDKHRLTLCKMTDCQHLLNLYQHILIEQQQKKRRHSMPVTANPSQHNKENARYGSKIYSQSFQGPGSKSLSNIHPLGISSHLDANLQPGKSFCRSLSPSSNYQSTSNFGFCDSHQSPSPYSQTDHHSPKSYPHSNNHSSQPQCRLSTSSFPPDQVKIKYQKFNPSCHLLDPHNFSLQISPETSPHNLEKQLKSKSTVPRPLIPENVRSNLKPATAIYKTSPSAPGGYSKVNMCAGYHLDGERYCVSNHCEKSPMARSVCTKNSKSQNGKPAASAEHSPASERQSFCSNEKISPTISLPKENVTSTIKSKPRLSFGPLQDPVMSSTQRSSELRFNGSFVSQNTIGNHSDALRSPTGSVRSLPTCFHQSSKNSNSNLCVPLKFEATQSDSNYSYVRKLSFSSSVQSLPTALNHCDKVLQSAKLKAVKDVDDAAAVKVSFANLDAELLKPVSPTSSVKDCNKLKVPDTPNTDCFRSMSNEERRQFLLQQRSLLEEERNRLVAILERPDLTQSLRTEPLMPHSCFKHGPNLVQGLGGAALITHNLPLKSFDEQSKNEHTERKTTTDFLLMSPPTPNSVSNEAEDVLSDCFSVKSSCSFSSKHSSMSLIDLIDSIELKKSPLDDNQKSSIENCVPKIFPLQDVYVTPPQKQELILENQVLQDIFFLN